MYALFFFFFFWWNNLSHNCHCDHSAFKKCKSHKKEVTKNENRKTADGQPYLYKGSSINQNSQQLSNTKHSLCKPNQYFMKAL